MDSGLAGGSTPWTPGGYIPVANILFIPVRNTLFIPVPSTFFIPVSHILFIPVSSTLFIPVPYILFNIPVSNTSFIPVSHIIFIPVSNTFLSQSATHCLPQWAPQSLSQFYIFQFYILISSASRTQITQVRSSSCQFFHLFIISIPFRPVKNHISIIISSLSLVFSFFVLILFIFTFFYLLYFITILISTFKSFFVLSKHLHIYSFSCLPLSLFAICLLYVSVLSTSA